MFNLVDEGINHHSLADPAVGPLVAVASKSRNVVLADMHSGAAWLVKFYTE